jgi:hypothetical protein
MTLHKKKKKAPEAQKSYIGAGVCYGRCTALALEEDLRGFF